MPREPPQFLARGRVPEADCLAGRGYRSPVRCEGNVYAPMSWVCVLNPSVATFQAVRPLLAEAYQLAVSRYAKRETRG